MNVLQILPELRVGGVETGTVDLARHLVKLGHKAVIVSNGGPLVKDIEDSGAIHYTLPVHKKSFFHILRMVPRLIEIIEKEKIDIIHARSRAPAWVAYFASRKTRRVFITTCHGYYSRHLFSYVMGWAKRVIVPSNVIGRHMIEDFAVPRERIRLIPRSVDLERFKYIPYQQKNTQDAYHVGIIGRITPLKGHISFIKSMAKVVRVVPNLKIWIVGDAPSSKMAYKEQLQVLVKRLGLWHCTEFLGTQKDIPEIMRHLDVVVLATTTQEAFGRVIVEAQACGVPVVATSVGGVVDIIEDGRTGLLVPPSDPVNMAEAVIKLNKNASLASQLSANAYQKVKEKYTVERMVQATIGVYQEALHSKNILLIKFSSLGDIILSTAAMQSVREKFPQCVSGNALWKNSISFLVGDESKDVMLVCPHIDELLVADFKGQYKGITGLLRLAAVLRKKHFDIVIDFQNNRKSHLLAFLSFALERYGYDNRKLGFLLNQKVSDDRAPIGPVEHQFKILKMLDIPFKNPSLELWPTKDDQKYIEEFLNAEWARGSQKLVGINLSASPRWMSKQWPLRHMVALCEALGHKDIRVVITGTDKDISQAKELFSLVKNVKPILACGRTSVNQLVCLMKYCSVYISGDSAPLHIAASAGIPIVALFGPTDPKRHLPPARKCIVINKDLPCSPCYKSKCGHGKCMQQISPAEVLEAIEKLL